MRALICLDKNQVEKSLGWDHQLCNSWRCLPSLLCRSVMFGLGSQPLTSTPHIFEGWPNLPTPLKPNQVKIKKINEILLFSSNCRDLGEDRRLPREMVVKTRRCNLGGLVGGGWPINIFTFAAKLQIPIFFLALTKSNIFLLPNLHIFPVFGTERINWENPFPTKNSALAWIEKWCYLMFKVEILNCLKCLMSSDNLGARWWKSTNIRPIGLLSDIF